MSKKENSSVLLLANVASTAPIGLSTSVSITDTSRVGTGEIEDGV